MIRKIIGKLTPKLRTMLASNERLDEIVINQGRILSTLNQNKTSKNLKDYEFKIFSQWGEDGILQYLIQSIEIKNKTFIEFGVEDFFESNCRFLMMKDNWRGFVIDGSHENISRLQNSYFYWKHDLKSITEFITRKNINELLDKSGFEKDLGILSVDLDGNDYFVLQAIEKFVPRILICEYNSVFGKERKISIPYNPQFHRRKAHHSALYWGASLAAITDLADRKGYSLVGSNSAGNNAFYVRKDLINSNLEALTVDKLYRPSNYRESRDERGNLTYVTGDKRLDAIKGMPVLNIETGKQEVI